MMGADQDQVGQLGGAAVFPVLDVVCVQTAGGPATGNRAGGMAVFQGAAKPSVDQPGGPPGTDDLTVAFEPRFTGGITGQVPTFRLRQQRAQMQGSDPLLDVHMHHHGGVVSVRAAAHLGVPAGLDQPQERLGGAGQRGPSI